MMFLQGLLLWAVYIAIGILFARLCHSYARELVDRDEDYKATVTFWPIVLLIILCRVLGHIVLQFKPKSDDRP